ncbi:MAG TPA: hypothetical protein VFU14_15485 [Acidimicrobiales bacterium]|nr:hypothetical protein [Acidimicrobiales bacterium]
MTDADDRPAAAWVFEVDPHEVDLAAAFADGEAVLQFEVAPHHAPQLRPGQVAHLWVQDRLGEAVPPGIYATGSVVGPVEEVDDDGEVIAVVSVGLDSLRTPVDGTALLADELFWGSPLHAGTAGENPIPLDAAQARAVALHELEPGPLAGALGAVDQEDGAIALPALEVRLPDDTLLVVEGVGHPGWTVVRASPDMATVEELPEQHATFMDAVEYVATAVGGAGGSLPVVDIAEGIEAVAIFDADGGVYVVVKEDEDAYTFAWVDDDGEVERLDQYATLKEAILLPVLDEELFGGM